MRTITCPGCGAVLDVSAFASGTEFACGGCGAALRVPGEEAAAAPAAADAPSAPGRAPRTARTPRPARAPRRREPSGEEEPAKAPRTGLLVGVGAGVLLLGGIGTWLAMRAGKPAGPAADPGAATTALRPKSDGAKKELPPEEAEWFAAKTETEKKAVAAKRSIEAQGSDDLAKAAHQFFVAKGRVDFAKQVVKARLDAAPDSAWANETLGRINVQPDLEALAPKAAALDEAPTEAWTALKARIGEKRWWVDPAELAEVQQRIASVQEMVKQLEDPWFQEAMAVVKEVRSAAPFRIFKQIDYTLLPPYVVLAEHQEDSHAHQTVNVLSNNAKFYKCLTGEFLKVMGEAGLPTPTVAEMGNPVLKAFVFTGRNSFQRWHEVQGQKIPGGIRAYYAWGGSRFMMNYDTGAPTSTQDGDTCVAFHEATHQLVHYYRHYYVNRARREKDPKAEEIPLDHPLLNLDPHWFQEGFAELMGAADRISSQTGEWRLMRPLRSRLAEWGDPTRRASNQWTLAEVVEMGEKWEMEAHARKKWGADRAEGMQSLFYAQAWALNHYLYFGEDGKYRERYLKIVHDEMMGVPGAEVFYRRMEAPPAGPERMKWLEDLQYGLFDHVNRLNKNR
jgi:hypothetical protein